METYPTREKMAEERVPDSNDSVALALEEKVKRHTARIKKIEEKIAKTEDEIDTIEEKVEKTEGDIENIESLKQHLMEANVSLRETKIKKIEAEVDMIKEEIKTIDEKKDSTRDESRYNTLKERLKEAKEDLDKANERLDKANERLKEARNYQLQLTQAARQVPTVEDLLKTLEWREPKQFCGSSGRDWEYQGRTELVNKIEAPLVKHYNAWKDRRDDKQSHALFLVLSGPGTGKSRMLDEMKVLLYKAAEQSKNEDLMQRMRNAYVFHVTFENGTLANSELLDSKEAEFQVSYRMLYQLSKEREKKMWPIFAKELDTSYSSLRIQIADVIAILAKLKKIDNVKDMTVILCVDGLQQLVNDGTKSCDFYRVLTAVCGVLNMSTAFAVCICSATVQVAVDRALVSSTQERVFLLPPTLNGEEVLSPRTRTEKQLVEDMGGHGRALEALEDVLHRAHKKKSEEEEEIDPTYLIDEVYNALTVKYGNLFELPLFEPTTSQEVLVAVLSRRRYNKLSEKIGQTELTVDELRSFGLFRRTVDNRLDCAFIILVMLMRNIPRKVGEIDNFDEHLTRSVLVWQRFEQFVAFYRRVKSIAYHGILVDLGTFHSGARFSQINGNKITELNPRKVVEAVKQHDTKSGSNDLTCLTNRDGSIIVSAKDTIIINGPGAPAGDIFMGIQLTIGARQVECNEVIQCKLLQTKQKITEEMYNIEREKAVNKTSDVFLLITTAEANGFDLPARCGIVSKKEFEKYFGPFATRAYRSFQDPPNINTASYHELRRIEGVGDATAEKIIKERSKGRFSNCEDAVERLFSDKKRKLADILRAMHCDQEA